MKLVVALRITSLWLLTVGLVSSCSLWKRSERSARLATQFQRHSLLDSGGWRLDREAEAWEWSTADQRVVILPRGLVRFHPDSGFSGEAELLLLETNQQVVAFHTDTVGVEVATLHSRDRVDGRLHQTNERYRETDVQPLWQLPWWGWVFVVILLLTLVLWWCRKLV